MTKIKSIKIKQAKRMKNEMSFIQLDFYYA